MTCDLMADPLFFGAQSMPHYRVYPLLDLASKPELIEADFTRKIVYKQNLPAKLIRTDQPAVGLWVGAALVATTLLFIVAAYW